MFSNREVETTRAREYQLAVLASRQLKNKHAEQKLLQMAKKKDFYNLLPVEQDYILHWYYKAVELGL